MTPLYSVILPVYNEASRIGWLVESYSQALNSVTEAWELILVINGSVDDSLSVATELSKSEPRLRVFESKLSGWGRALKLGFSQSRGSLICYTNSARTELPDLLLALRYASINQDVVVKASRIKRDSWIRMVASSLYNFEYRLLFQVPVWDVNGTPKVLSRKVLEDLPPFDSLSDGDLIDAQLIARCFRTRIPILEMPVLCTRRYGGKSTTTWRTAWRLYTGLIRLRWTGL